MSITDERKSSRVWRRWIERTCFGRPMVFTIFEHNGALLLSANENEWQLQGSDLVLKFEPGTTAITSRFIVERRGTLIWSFTYVHIWRTLVSRLDPTYDALDFETDHMLFFIAKKALSPTWQANVLNIIERGSAA